MPSANISTLNAADEEAKVETLEGEFYRLIPSRFPPVAVYDGLVANDRIDALVRVEDMTNPRLQSERRLAARSERSVAGTPQLQNWNLAPFAYPNPEGSRFFKPDRSCLELADDPQTALAVSVSRRELFLTRTNEAPIGLDMRMLKRPVKGRFVDFRALPSDLGRTDRLRLGAAVPTDVDGVIFHPPERPSATCLAVLRGEALGRAIQTVHYRFVWNGARISKLYAFDQEGRELLPESLASPEDILAA